MITQHILTSTRSDLSLSNLSFSLLTFSCVLFTHQTRCPASPWSVDLLPGMRFLCRIGGRRSVQAHYKRPICTWAVLKCFSTFKTLLLVLASIILCFSIGWIHITSAFGARCFSPRKSQSLPHKKQQVMPASVSKKHPKYWRERKFVK